MVAYKLREASFFRDPEITTQCAGALYACMEI